ncbi:MAG: hypothetical protein QGI45_07425 [Myxococcota bacterium]|nr:hypothetical protein [Myxococcota bacterium]
MRILVYGFLSFVLLAPQAEKQLVNTDVGLVLTGPAALIEAASPLFSLASRKLAGPQSAVQLKVAGDGSVKNTLQGELDVHKLYGHWLKQGGFLKERSVLSRLGLNKLRQISFELDGQGKKASHLDIRGVKDSQLPLVLSHLRQVPQWRPGLAVGEAYANMALQPDRLWALLQRLAGGLYAMETALLATNLASIERQLKTSLLKDALGQEVKALWFWRSLQAGQEQWAMKLGVKNGVLAQKILSPFLFLLPALVPGLAVTREDVGQAQALVLSRPGSKRPKVYVWFTRDGIFMGNHREKMREMKEAKPSVQTMPSSDDVARGGFRPDKRTRKIWSNARERRWAMTLGEDHMAIALE